MAIPLDVESVGDEVVGHDDSDVDQSSSDVEQEGGLPPIAKISSQEEANSLYHLLNQKPKTI